MPRPWSVRTGEPGWHNPRMTWLPSADRYDAMRYRRSGRSGLLLPAVSLDLWITHFDLANNYGPPYGSAEENFGRIMASDLRPYRDELVVSSKAGYDMWAGPYGDFGSRKYLLSSLDASLTRLGLDYVDIFYHHRPDPETPVEESMGALAHAVRSGKALYAGISNYGPDETRRAYEALQAEGVPLLIHQPSYSMFNRLPEEGLLDAVGELGIGSIVFSPLAQGLLTNRYLDGIPADSRAAEGRWINESTINEEYLERARGLNAIAEARGQSLAQLALLWVLRQPTVTSALIGASSVRQLEDNLGALAGEPLTADEIAAIEPFAVHGTV